MQWTPESKAKAQKTKIRLSVKTYMKKLSRAEIDNLLLDFVPAEDLYQYFTGNKINSVKL
jgi:hypothetical protein